MSSFAHCIVKTQFMIPAGMTSAREIGLTAIPQEHPRKRTSDFHLI